MAERRATVDGWRWDFLTPWGWFPSSGILNHYGNSAAGEPQGWYTRERAVCLTTTHHAPHPGCVCGVHGIEHLTETVAQRLEQLDKQRNNIIAGWVEEANGNSITGGAIPNSDVLVIALSKATFEDVLPTAWPDDAQALAAHPDAFADPPHTIRAHRKTYREIFVDREWPTAYWPQELPLENGIHFTKNLAAFARQQLTERTNR